MTTIVKLAQPPLSLYIHIPWCAKKCPYCDFNSHVTKAIPEGDYVAALMEDLDEELSRADGRDIRSIFFGGGTPSLFSGQAIHRILQETEKKLRFAKDIEITLEANPGSVEQQKFLDYRSAGINRLSIGVQSFNQDHLEKLGRIHSNNEAILAADSARKAGFDNFNIDLMHGLPNQSKVQALEDIQKAIGLQPTHISWYQLTIEPNTVFFNSPPLLPSDDNLADIQESGERLLKEHSYHQYEVSAFSKNSQRSKHNMNYWLFGDYIGIGAGAHGKWTDAKSSVIERNWKTRIPKDYLNPNKPFRAGRKLLDDKELPLEFMMNALRLNHGFEKRTFTENTGLEYTAIESTIAQLKERNLILEEGSRIYPSDLGRRFLNDMLTAF